MLTKEDGVDVTVTVEPEVVLVGPTTVEPAQAGQEEQQQQLRQQQQQQCKMKEQNSGSNSSNHNDDDDDDDDEAMCTTSMQLYNQVVELLHLKCPRCKLAFDYSKYKGCNALRCAKKSCKTSFCAICWKDCGTNRSKDAAHAHVIKEHKQKNLYNKHIFQKIQTKRRGQIIGDFLKNLGANKQTTVHLVPSVKNLLGKGGP
jgi:hypothetical protein